MNEPTEIPETVILEMQRKVRDFKMELLGKEDKLKVVIKDYNSLERQRAYAALKLRETLDFLQEHNKDAVKFDWFSDEGLTRDSLVNQERPMTLPLDGLDRCFKFFMGQTVKWSKMSNEHFTVVGIQRKEILIEGDFSQMGAAIQQQWVPIEEVES
jgi:hypothetical protein